KLWLLVNDSLSASGDGPTRITNPFAPGARIELRARQSRDLQTEQAVAGRAPRAAHGCDLRRASAGQPLFPSLTQRRRRQEAPVRAEIGRKRLIYRALDM